MLIRVQDAPGLEGEEEELPTGEAAAEVKGKGKETAGGAPPKIEEVS